MKRAGVHCDDLLRIYLSVIRPVVEYACQVWHTCLPDYLSNDLEAVQKRALQCIFPQMNYRDVLNLYGLPSLSERRDIICDKYFDKILENDHKLNHLVTAATPSGYHLRTQRLFAVPLARTNRFKKSFIPTMMRRRNEMM